MNFSPQNVERRLRRVMSDLSLSRKEKFECLDQIRRTVPAWIRKYPLTRLNELTPAQAHQYRAGLRVVEAAHQLLVEEIRKQEETAK
jgi:hypothetical protein